MRACRRHARSDPIRTVAELPEVTLHDPVTNGCVGGFDLHAGWWRLARIKPGRDFRYLGQLLAVGAVCYAPMGMFASVWTSGQVVRRLRPLFAGYAFVATDGPLPPSDHLICQDPIDDQARVIADLERLHAFYLDRQPVREEMPLEPNQFVRVKFGNRAGAEGYVDPAPRGNAADGRVYVLLHTLGRWLSVPIERWQLEVA
jgi:hypothetical protein